MITDINKNMLLALDMAKEAYEDGEVPVGAVITRCGEVIATGRNRREKEKTFSRLVPRSGAGGCGTAKYSLP